MDSANFQFDQVVNQAETPLDNVLNATNGTLTVTDNVLDYTNTVTNINSGLGYQQLTIAQSSNNKSGIAKNSKINDDREISNIPTTSQEINHAKLDGLKQDADIEEKIILDLNRTI